MTTETQLPSQTMVVDAPKADIYTIEGISIRNGKCDGCPRCNPKVPADSAWCAIQHPRWAPLHPVCRLCGHCVLRGKHDDDLKVHFPGKYKGKDLDDDLEDPDKRYDR